MAQWQPQAEARGVVGLQFLAVRLRRTVRRKRVVRPAVADLAVAVPIRRAAPAVSVERLAQP